MASIGHENLETVMIDFFGALRRGDFEGAAALLDPDVTWQGLREDWVCHGREEVLQIFRWGLERRREVDALEFTRGGYQVVLGDRGPSITEVAGKPLEGQIFNVFSLSDGRIVRLETTGAGARRSPQPALLRTRAGGDRGCAEVEDAVFTREGVEAGGPAAVRRGRAEHLLLGLLAQPEEMAARALKAIGVTPQALRARVLERLPPSAPRPGGSLGAAPQTSGYSNSPALSPSGSAIAARALNTCCSPPSLQR